MIQVIPEIPPGYERTRIVERPNGFFWQSKDGGREYGPFATLLEAEQDMHASDDTGAQSPLTLEEAESRLGIADFIDPETGEPGEAGHPRLEDH